MGATHEEFEGLTHIRSAHHCQIGIKSEKSDRVGLRRVVEVTLSGLQAAEMIDRIDAVCQCDECVSRNGGNHEVSFLEIGTDRELRP